MSATYSNTDSQRFGIEIYRARCNSLADVQRTVAEAQGLAGDVLILRFPTREIEVFAWLNQSSLRWYFGDTLVHYKNRCDSPFPATPREGFSIRTAGTSDVPAIEEIAEELFSSYSNHYLCNPRTSDGSKLSAGCAEWAIDFILNSSPSRYCLLVESREKLAGYITGEVRGSAGHIVIGGIRTQFQKHGLYRWMLERWSNDLKELGAEHVEFSTQVQNSAVQKVWTRLGFEIFESEYTVHVELGESGSGGEPG